MAPNTSWLKIKYMVTEVHTKLWFGIIDDL